jgi:hypothetical protein
MPGLAPPVKGRPAVERMPHSCTNVTTTDGSTVIKSYQGPDAAQRCVRDATVLSALARRLPVPPVLNEDPGRCGLA